jgi:hypothetical protein
MYCTKLFESLDRKLDERMNLDEIGKQLCDTVEDPRGKAIRLIKAYKGEEYLQENAEWLEFEYHKVNKNIVKNLEVPIKPSLPKLIIDPEFSTILPPLKDSEFSGLEKELLTDGCYESITTWHGIIIDGHARYRICHFHKIPFKTNEIELEDREEVYWWIIHHQLARKNLDTKEIDYFIGKRAIAAREAAGEVE